MGTEPQQARTGRSSHLTESAVRFAQSLVVDAAGLTHQGLVRTSNEDHFLIGRLGRYFETVRTSLPQSDLPDRADEAGYSLIVADGMGGHAGGELASQLAIREIVRLALALPDWIGRLEDSTLEAAAMRAQSRKKLNTMVIEQGQRDPDLRGMGCTLTVARNLGRVPQIAHVGDSRAYLLREGRLHRLTRDHTYVQRGQAAPVDSRPHLRADARGQRAALPGGSLHVDGAARADQRGRRLQRGRA